jgi:hypothetical protein
MATKLYIFYNNSKVLLKLKLAMANFCLRICGLYSKVMWKIKETYQWTTVHSFQFTAYMFEWECYTIFCNFTQTRVEKCTYVPNMLSVTFHASLISKFIYFRYTFVSNKANHTTGITLHRVLFPVCLIIHHIEKYFKQKLQISVIYTCMLE